MMKEGMNCMSFELVRLSKKFERMRMMPKRASMYQRLDMHRV